ncbi:MAG: efflux RND transporter permease subunit [Oscillospiraceae bacterium]|nr:efflux RND transporter permease subunit [Oscillospiraceae bacterium]
MFSKFSVKKPYTVFVGIVVVIVLGVVSFLNLTPDLLPSMDFPYVIITTTYVGASPEEVEETVTKPMEESMARLDNINSISSTSSENYSMVMLEFAEGTDLGIASVDITNAIGQLESGWDDSVGTPIMLKINPNMLATAVVAVSVDGLDEYELTSFVENNLLSQLEGVEGVASVSAEGMISRSVELLISEDKIEKLNARIEKEIIKQFDEAYTAIEDAEQQLSDGKEAIAVGRTEIKKGREELEKAKAEAEEQLEAGKDGILFGYIQIDQARKELQAGEAELLKQMDTLYATYDKLLEAQVSIETLKQSKVALTGTLTALRSVQEFVDANPDLDYSALDEMISEMTGGQYDSYSALVAGIAEVEAGIAAIDQYLSDIDAALGEFGYSSETVGQAISDLEAGIAECEKYQAEIQKGYEELAKAEAAIVSGEMAMEEGEAEARKQFAEAEKMLDSTASQLAASSGQIEAAEEELAKNREKIDTAMEEAVGAADVDQIINLELVATILYAQNFEMPAGYVLDGGEPVLLRVGDKFEDVTELEDLVLFDMGIEGIGAITISDVAEINYTDNSDSTYANINGNRGVILSFNKQSNYATATVSENLDEKFAQLEEKFEGLQFAPLMDQGDYIDIIISSVLENMIIGAVLAIIILAVFLRDIRPTFMVALSIPISVVFAIVLMYFSGVTLNIISLAGLAAGIGMLVDNSIVVIENTYRLRSLGLSPIKAAVSGASQVAGAITSSTLTTICVFLPIVFVKGITKQLFQDMALTIAYSLLASLIIALTLIPAMAPTVLKKVKENKDGEGKFIQKYGKLVETALNKKAFVLILSVLLLAGSAYACISRGFIFMPNFESNQLTVNISLPEDSVLDDTAKICDEFGAEIKKINGVETVGTMLSGGMESFVGMSGGSSDVTSATMYIILDSDGEKEAGKITANISDIAENYKDSADISVSGGMMDSMSMLTGSGVTVDVYGNDIEDITATAKEIGDIIRDIDGVSYVSAGEEKTEPTINISVNKNEAMKNGLTVAQVLQEIAGKIVKNVSASTIETDEGEYDVIIISESGENFTREDIENYVFNVTKQDGTKAEVKLSDIAEIKDGNTLSSINRISHRRYLTVSAGIAEGHNVTLVAADIERALADYKAPEGVTYEFSGENESIMEAMWELVKMLGIGVILVYLIMVAQFQSLRSPFIVMFTIPLAFTGAFIALMIWGLEISVVAMIGLIMLVGIIVNNGIVLVDCINQLREGGMERRAAVIEASKTRLRPIFMTALTTVLGLVPIALGFGFGSSLIQPVAVCCIGGLLYATVMTLFVIPVMYELLSRKNMNVISEDDLEISEL